MLLGMVCLIVLIGLAITHYPEQTNNALTFLFGYLAKGFEALKNGTINAIGG
jgi:hypothetical protein